MEQSTAPAIVNDQIETAYAPAMALAVENDDSAGMMEVQRSLAHALGICIAMQARGDAEIEQKLLENAKYVTAAAIEFSVAVGTMLARTQGDYYGRGTN